MMVHDKNNPEDLDTALEDHAVDTCRYLLNTRVRASKDPNAAPPSRKPDPRPLFLTRKEYFA